MKVLIIGLDGATWDVFDDYLLENHMPVLNRLKQTGTSGVLQSTEPPITWAAWTSFLTGCEPATHGIFATEKYNCSDDSLRIVTAADRTVPNLWEVLSEQGYKIISIGVPYTYPCSIVNGVLVAGFGCPGMDSDITYPAEFKQELLSELPDYNILADWKEQKRYSFDELDKGLSSVETRFNQRLGAVKLAVKKVDWDVMMVHFHNTDMMEHRIWPFLDSKTRDLYPKYRDRAFKTFEKLDEKIAELIEIAGENSLVVFASDHGLCLQTAKARPNSMLCEWGYLHRKGFLERKLQKTFGKAKHRKLKQPNERAFNWHASAAMVVTMTTNAHLYLNVKGRQPSGVVELGSEYDSTIADLRKRFSEIINPLTNRPVFSKVGTSGEIYNTKDPTEHGDLILVPDEGIEIRVSASTKNKGLEPMADNSLVGWHNYKGVYGICGPDVKKGFLHNTKITNIIPTIYAAIGAKLPSLMDGEVLKEIFEKEISYEYQTETTEIKRKNAEGESLTIQEEEKILKSLKALGYIE
jgi:predicted AlkP superfamily phosphohydrolase/phosphomutase